MNGTDTGRSGTRSRGARERSATVASFLKRTFAIAALVGLAAAAAPAATIDLALAGPQPAALVAPFTPSAPEREPESTLFDGLPYRLIDDSYVDQEGDWWRPLVVTTTAYAPTTDQCDDDPDSTATGSNAFRNYGVAADPRALPYGTLLRIPGYGDAIVDDTGSAMRRSWTRGIIHLDLRIPLRRYDGAWRSEDEATRIAQAHGVRRNRIILMKVAPPTQAPGPLP